MTSAQLVPPSSHPSGPVTGGIHHLALGARDVPLLARFYEDVFGLVRLAEHRFDDGQIRSIWLQLNPGMLMIERTDEIQRPVEGVGAGFFLLALRVDDPAAFELRLLDYGASCEARTLWSSYFRDPEGNRLAVSRYELESP